MVVIKMFIAFILSFVLMIVFEFFMDGMEEIIGNMQDTINKEE